MPLLHLNCVDAGRGETPTYVPYHAVSFFFAVGDRVEVRLKDGRTLYHRGGVGEVLGQIPDANLLPRE